MRRPAKAFTLKMGVRFFIFSILLMCLTIQFVPSSESASPAHECINPTGWSSSGGAAYTLKQDNVGMEFWSAGSAQAARTGGYFNPDYSAYPQENIAIDNATIVDMWISIRVKIPHDDGLDYNGGKGRSLRMEYYIGDTSNVSAFPADWDASYNQSFPYTNDTAYVGVGPSNEVTIGWRGYKQVNTHAWTNLEFHIFNESHWTAYKLQRYYIYVGITSPDFPTTSDEMILVDYIGIHYAWVEDIGWQSTDYQPLLFGLIWLIVIFFPAIALRSGFGMIGFAGGIMLMTILVGIADSGFLPVTVISLIAIGLLFMRS